MSMTRDELIYLLNEAAELEHMLSCQYMYASFSLKRDVSEGVTTTELNHITDWAQTLLVIAREEMSHLGLVCNLLTAIGAAPHFSRPNFPQPPKYYPFELALHPLSERLIKRYICIERPSRVEPADAFCFEEGQKSRRAGRAAKLSPHRVPFRTVGELYSKLAEGIRSYPGDDRTLFIAPAEIQVESAELTLMYPLDGVFHTGLFDVNLLPVVDRASALAVIATIVEQGEGGPGPAPEEPSHYKRFVKMREDWLRLEAQARKDGRAFEPARDLVSNPCLYHHAEAPGGTPIRDPDTSRVMDVADAAYGVLLLLFMRLYSHTDESPAEMQGLGYILPPFMVAVIRPLCELLTTMPAGRDGQLAGPGFEIDSTLTFLPYRPAAWQLIHERLIDAATRCRALGEEPGMPRRLSTIAQTMLVMAGRLQDYMDPALYARLPKPPQP